MAKKNIIAGLSVWFLVLGLSLVLFNAGDNWKGGVEVPAPSGTYPAPAPVVEVVEEVRLISRLEFLRLLSIDFFNTSFKEGDPLPGRSELWSVANSLGWVIDGSLDKGELIVEDFEAKELFNSIWGGDVTIESTDLSSSTYDAISRRVWTNRNNFSLTRSRGLELMISYLKSKDLGEFSSSDYSLDDVHYLDVEVDFYIPFLKIATSNEWLVGDWADSTFEPNAIITKPQSLSLIFSVLDVDIDDGLDAAEMALKNGLILRTELASYRLPRPIKYGEFRKLIIESKRVFGS